MCDATSEKTRCSDQTTAARLFRWLFWIVAIAAFLLGAVPMLLLHAVLSGLIPLEW